MRSAMAKIAACALALSSAIAGEGSDKKKPDNPKFVWVTSQKRALGIVKKALKAHGGSRIDWLRRARVAYRIKGDFPFLPEFGNVDITVTDTYQLPQRIKKEIHGYSDGKAVAVEWCATQNWYWYWERGSQTVYKRAPTNVDGQYRPYMLLDVLASHDRYVWALVDDAVDAPPNSIAVRCSGAAPDDERIYYFDRQTGLLAGSKSRRPNPILKREVLTVNRVGDYRETDGLQFYRTITTYQDGKKTAEIAISDVQILDEIDQREFLPPEQRPDGRMSLIFGVAVSIIGSLSVVLAGYVFRKYRMRPT